MDDILHIRFMLGQREREGIVGQKMLECALIKGIVSQDEYFV
jgi:hypothetical protein